MDFENMNIWCWIIALLIALLCLIIGYYWGKGNSTVIDNSTDLKALENKNARLQADLEACNKKLKSTSVLETKRKTTPKTKAAPASLAVSGFDAKAVKAAYGKRVKQDDLKVVEGIGPKIEGLFHDFDIKTWKALSDASVAKCREVLTSGGDRYRMHDPASWPMQAKMAYKGDWKKLAKWQGEHKAGKL